MKRDRSWRRYKQELVLKKRIQFLASKNSYYYWGFFNSNEDQIKHPTWVDHLGSKFTNFYKRDKTKLWTSKIKCKYSPNKNKGYYRDLKGKVSGCREKDKFQFKLILKENGLA